MRKNDKPTILLVAEAVSLAHFARIAVLSKALDPSVYRIIVASDPRYAHLDRPLGSAFRPLRSIPSAQFAEALARGKPVYDAGTLARYVDDDLALLREIKPDLVVGDFRLSLGVSAPLHGVTYAAIVNAYWSPYAEIQYPVPDIPISRWLGASMAQSLFDLIRPIAFALHARPLDQVRRRYGLPPIGHDLRAAYTCADHTLYADVPELVPMGGLPATHRYLGPLLWSADAPLPAWWEHMPSDRPVIMLTMGTSGQQELIPIAMAALAEVPATVIVATAGQIEPGRIADNAFVTDYLPMERSMRRCRLVICNGGSLTTYQALALGIPVLGVCSNMDQLLNMQGLERWGAGVCLRAAAVKTYSLRKTVLAMLEGPQYMQAAQRAQEFISRTDARSNFRAFVADMVGSGAGRER